ncbi:GbsR/MarR family transcriptional regulator [Candidatus Margulisiibacteriota bacterium]
MVGSEEVLKKAEDKFVEGIQSIGSVWGLNSVESKIIGYLSTQDRPVSLNTLVNNLKISKGNISVSIRKLEEKQIVNKVWVKGDRKDYYEINLELWQIFLKKMRENYRLETLKALETIEHTINTIQGSFAKLSNEASDRARNFMQKLQKMKSYYLIAEEISKAIDNEAKLEIPKIRVLWGSLKGHLKAKK